MKKVSQKKYDEMKQKTHEFYIYLVKNYPDKMISEYTRLEAQLEEFLTYGSWEPYDDN